MPFARAIFAPPRVKRFSLPLSFRLGILNDFYAMVAFYHVVGDKRRLVSDLVTRRQETIQPRNCAVEGKWHKLRLEPRMMRKQALALTNA